MVYPFPGMNPYLEHPSLWPGVHHWLIIGLAGHLSPQLRPQYRVAVEVRMYETVGDQSLLVGIPDVAVNRMQRQGEPRQNQPERSVALASTSGTVAAMPERVTVPVAETIKQGYLEIREVSTGQVITVVEILSPVNKRSGKGRQQYEEKRNRILNSDTHLVEIDLLREGQPMAYFSREAVSDYRVLVSRAALRPQAELYGFNLPDLIPTFPMPLMGVEQGPAVNLNQLLQAVYDQGSFDLAIDYRQPPSGFTEPAVKRWLNEILQSANL